MIPNKTIEDLISKHAMLEKELSAGQVDKKLFAEKSKEYSDLNEIIDDAKRFKEYFRDVFPMVKPNEIPFYGSILAIYTKDGKGLYGGALKKSAPPTIFEIETYDIIKDYYTPKHEDISATDFQTPDLRYPLYWNPNLKANEEGISKIEFYNADITGTIMVIIESISKIKVPVESANPGPASIVESLERSVFLIVPPSLTIISSVIVKSAPMSFKPLIILLFNIVASTADA